LVVGGIGAQSRRARGRGPPAAAVVRDFLEWQLLVAIRPVCTPGVSEWPSLSVSGTRRLTTNMNATSAMMAPSHTVAGSGGQPQCQWHQLAAGGASPSRHRELHQLKSCPWHVTVCGHCH
jgi:hypothetical protein